MPPRPAISSRTLPLFRRRLLAWFRDAKRDMPWRRTRDPYRIWLSEIMLQQTRVAAVIPYYQRFLERFPTVQALARARSDAVLAHWAGLGYYSRARNLHRAAKEIVATHHGAFPSSAEATLALPGIGRYTAAAVLSIAYGQPLAVLDGNVARVLARLFAVRGDLRQPRRWRRLQETAGRLLASEAAGDWNQAMMELGATICTPAAPLCEVCPVARWCRARASGLAEQLPSPRRKPAPVRMTIAAAVLIDPRGRTLLVRRPNNDNTAPAAPPDTHPNAAYKDNNDDNKVAALFSNLWHFPAVSAIRTRRRGPATRAGRSGRINNNARHDLAKHLECSLGFRVSSLEPLPAARHSVTFRAIRLAPFLARVERIPAVPGAKTPLLAHLDRLPVSSATRKLAAAAVAALVSGNRSIHL